MEKIGIALFASEDTAKALSTMLHEHPRLALSFSTGNPQSLLAYCATNHPTVIVLESSPETPDILTILHHIRTACPKSQCLIVAHDLNLSTVRKAVDAGAMGYLLIQSNFEALFAAIPVVQAGKIALSPQIVHLLTS